MRHIVSSEDQSALMENPLSICLFRFDSNAPNLAVYGESQHMKQYIESLTSLSGYTQEWYVFQTKQDVRTGILGMMKKPDENVTLVLLQDCVMGQLPEHSSVASKAVSDTSDDTVWLINVVESDEATYSVARTIGIATTHAQAKALEIKAIELYGESCVEVKEQRQDILFDI